MDNPPLPDQTDEEPPINIRISSGPSLSIPLHPRQRPRQYEAYAYEPPRQDGLHVPFHFQPSETNYRTNRSVMQLDLSPSIVTPTSTASLFAQTTPLQHLVDVAQFNQERANESQRRNEASHIHAFNTLFDWDSGVLTSQGLRLDRYRDVNRSSMSVCLEGTFSTDTQPFTDQWSDDLGEPQRQANEGYLGNAHDHLDPNIPVLQDGHIGNIAGLAPGPRQHGRSGSSNSQQALEVQAGVEQMVTRLDSLYLRSVQPDVTGLRNARRSFMCPYAMRYPHRVSHNCFQKLNTIPYVKQHLRHNHHDVSACPNRCQIQRHGARRPRIRPSAGLSFDATMCLRIKQRSDRSQTHKEQWARFYDSLFPGADRISDPYIEDSTVRLLRGIFKFMETQGAECLYPIYAQLPDTISYLAPEVMYRRAFCTWLPRVFEVQFSPQGQALPGDFVNQIHTFLNDDSFLLGSSSGPARLRNAAALPFIRRMDPSYYSFAPMSQMGFQPRQQPFYSAITSPYLVQHQRSDQPVVGASFSESQNTPTSSQVSYLDTPIPPQTDIDCVTPLPDGTDLDYQFDLAHDFSFDQFGPMQGSPSQFLDIDVEGDLSQLDNGDLEL